MELLCFAMGVFFLVRFFRMGIGFDFRIGGGEGLGFLFRGYLFFRCGLGG